VEYDPPEGRRAKALARDVQKRVEEKLR
jgi:hypothetical protein